MKKCKVEGCENKHKAKGYCGRHYEQIKKYGRVTKTGRSRLDPNEIIIHEDYAEIVLYDKQCEERARTFIDLDNVDVVKNYKWSFDESNGYVVNVKNNVLLHRLIINPPCEMMVDHINGNRLDNRKINLRIVTPQQNAINISRRCDNTSGHKGISWDKKSKKWHTYINIKTKRIHLGYFDSLEEAIEVRKQAEIEYFGEYRRDEDAS